jgi:hypothetical protein
MEKKWKIFWWSLVGLVLLVLLWILTVGVPTWWHAVIMLFYKNPFILYTLLISSIVGFVVGKIFKEKCYHKWRGIGIVPASTVFACTWIVLMIVCGLYSDWYAKYYVSQTLKVVEIQELPDTKNIRIMPMLVAKRYARDSLKYPKFSIGEEDITFIEKRPTWTFPLVPDGFFNKLRLNNKGAIYQRMDTSKRDIITVEREMSVGPGQAITDNVYWRLIMDNRFWRDYEDLFSVPLGDELYFVVPVTKYKLRYRFPTFYTYPVFDGVVIVDSSGKVYPLTPEQALEHNVLDGQEIFSDYIARYYVLALNYVKGLNNVLYDHDDQHELADIKIYRGTGEERKLLEENKQPFLINTENGLMEFFAVEPYGKAYGIFKIFIVDSRTGAIYVKKIEKSLIGPVKACDYVRKSRPRVSWNSIRPTESIPHIKNGVVFWEVRVVPDDYAGVSYTAFVNSETGDVIEFETDADIQAFVEGKSVAKAITETVAESSGHKKSAVSKGDYMTVTIISPNGEKKVIKIEKGSKVVIQ